MAAHAFMLGAAIFDTEITHEGLGHGQCYEKNFGSRYPSRAKLYAVNLAPVAVITFADTLMRKKHIKVAPYTTPFFASSKNLRAATRWLTDCW